MERSQYLKKLKKCFGTENFEKLKTNPTKSDIEKFRKALKKFLNYIDPNQHKYFEPVQKLKNRIWDYKIT